MARSNKVTSFMSLLLLMFVIPFFCLFYGCGSGEETPASSSTTTSALGSMSLSMTKTDRTPTTSVSIDSPVILTAVATDSAGSPIVQKVVSFSTTADLSFNPASGTALTDSSGKASITVNAGTSTGATTITAEVTLAAGTVSGDIGIAVLPPNLSLSPLTIDPLAISAGGSAGVSVTVLDGSGNPFATSVPVSFTSNGVSAGKATITPQVYTINGVASATYTDKNYGNVDTITATLSIGGTTFIRTGTITVNPASAGSISFVSATPTSIALKGTGGQGRSETSVVVFKVLDTNGNPIKKKVNFSLVPNTAVGGLSITANNAYSDPTTGLVQTIVQAGTVSTPVRVSATIDGTSISSTSDLLVVSTGIPAQDSFSIAASTLNIEGWKYDGVTTDITVRLADHFKNPVPDGTAVSFWTSGGSIQPSCTTTSGACTATLTSQDPRPWTGQTDPKPTRNGHVVVLAFALGEESFVDMFGSGMYELGDPFTDMPEPWLDVNENGVWDIYEPFVDTNGDGKYSYGDGIYNGILRDPSITGPTTIHVRNSIMIVFSGSDAVITINDGNDISLNHCVNGTPFSNFPETFAIRVTDVNGNVMPAGTTITFSTTNGTILSAGSFTVPNTSASPPTYYVTMISDATQGAGPAYTCSNTITTGIFTVTVRTPKEITTYGYANITD